MFMHHHYLEAQRVCREYEMQRKGFLIQPKDLKKGKYVGRRGSNKTFKIIEIDGEDVLIQGLKEGRLTDYWVNLCELEPIADDVPNSHLINTN
jgi:hypothetical protein